MDKNTYLIIAIIIIISLIIIFFVSFYLYKKTPVPKGCEKIKIDEELCSKCSNNTCYLKEKSESKEEE